MKKLFISAAALSLAMSVSSTTMATNGMNLEGYGPVALGMGGSSMAYDNGTAGSINNPATIGLTEGQRFDVALGFLGPNIDASAQGMTANSSADAFYMPAIGWTNKKGTIGYGFTIYGQGGMGTEYGANSFLAAGSGETVRSEVGIGRAMIPVTYDVNNKLTIGGTADFVWIGMDLKMAMNGAQFGDMVSALGGSQSGGTANGTMVDGLVAAMPAMIGGLNWARFDFSNSSDFYGEARGYGVAGKIGLAYKVNPEFTLGATYHSKTSISDLETDNATVSMNVLVNPTMSGSSYTAMTIPVTGKIKVTDFEWPDMLAFGIAFQATNKLLIASDIKYTRWSETMKDFTMEFTADATQDNPMAAGFAGSELRVVHFQDWDDQTVVTFGVSYDVTNDFTVRAGYNYASNPVPNEYLNPLFPAIVETHVTAGVGYDFNESSTFNFAASIGLNAEETNPGTGVTSEHSQFNWQLMYSYTF